MTRDEIEKMYENAKIDYEERYNDCISKIKRGCPSNSPCDICKYSEEKYIYPPFTEKKQIELIKWLLYHELIEHLKMYYTSEEGGILDMSIKCMSCYSYSNDNDDDFDIALASLINGLWQDLTEEEKQQIKEILE